MIKSVVLSIIASYGLQLRPANVLNACSHKISGLRSPALARAMIFPSDGGYRSAPPLPQQMYRCGHVWS